MTRAENGAPAGTAPGESPREEFTSALETLRKRADEESVPGFVHALLDEAVLRRASDVYLEPGTAGYRVRFRVDGVFQDEEGVPPGAAVRAVARLKVLARLVVYRKETPQEGHLLHETPSGGHDVRVSFSPTVRGERAVCRLFSAALDSLELSSLGLDGAVRASLEAVLERPQGLLIVAGPAGSGKTTTLYACMSHLLARRGSHANLVSIEDPVERLLPGIHQTSVNAAQGLTYPVALRALLRQDPEILLLGEVRDDETAALAVQAGLTGHLVLTSFHAADGPDAFLRLVTLGVEPPMAASAIVAVEVQRLVRRLCPDCRAPGPDDTWTAPGCGSCNRTGYRGRLPLAEFLRMDADTARALREGLSSRELADRIARGRTATFESAAAALLARGETSRAEVARVLGTAEARGAGPTQ